MYLYIFGDSTYKRRQRKIQDLEKSATFSSPWVWNLKHSFIINFCIFGILRRSTASDNRLIVFGGKEDSRSSQLDFTCSLIDFSIDFILFCLSMKRDLETEYVFSILVDFRFLEFKEAHFEHIDNPLFIIKEHDVCRQFVPS